MTDRAARPGAEPSETEIDNSPAVAEAGALVARYLSARDNGERLGEPDFDDCCLSSEYGLFLARKLYRLWCGQNAVRGGE